MIHFIYLSYRPNTAPTNRALACLKSIDTLDIPIQAHFLLPDNKKSKIEEIFRNITIHYGWEHHYIDLKYLNYLSYFNYLLQLRKELRPGDKIYIYSLNDIVRRMVFKEGVKVYYEITESPEVSLATTELCKPTLKKHIAFCKRLTGLFVISEQLRQYYINKGVDRSKIHVINMTVDHSRFNGLKSSANTDNYIAYCGTASNNKDGVDQLIKAFSRVAEQIPDVLLYIIGETPNEQDSSGNKDLVQQLHLNDKIVFTGILASEKLPQILKDAHVLALARPDNKQAKYGFPTKLGEYLLTGNPVVVTSVGDIPLFLKDGINAMVAPPDNPDLFAEKVMWLFRHPEESKRIGEKGKETALKSFNALTESKKMMDVILES